ncbi:single-stranded-DNA-specific exonuclease RecJ [Picosynechococcus sp. PCC 7117]|uniref:single-stranded-DNA-specific exonuclease RecJ n=1 Tax=Picosynechococcus sp. PCC 7117 TaxID=195498 RepID=UPI0008109015|nr:single-stranded-DNA-specific exonuclease RecJ [Picosynechococcus sp. PCC 7117]ANV86881.1 single-stranded-DNA-specific exonuclease RecJ [Picosynechococcus sp. PCC 7117]
MNFRLPQQRWHIADRQPDITQSLVEAMGLNPLVAQVLVNRNIRTPEQAKIYIQPESQRLPAPLVEFEDLALSVELLQEAIAEETLMAICGDYDADGMTSTALLLRALGHVGAKVTYAIPSRMKDGYGINERIVTELAEEGVGLILTVDNGISAYEPINLARDLGLDVIITDHHDLPDQLPPANAILNPKLLPTMSPYAGLAGVGVAYVLAVSLAQAVDKLEGLTSQILELFTLGTIADLAPLTGVNRRWLKRGLKLLPQSELAGVQALMQIAGVDDQKKQLKPDDIGFRLGPRINAVGRIDDPQKVIELLTTDEPGLALERAMQCEQINKQRQEMCTQIEAEAIALVEETPIDYQGQRVLVVCKEEWHHGVIGIVASRLVERYGVPVFICTAEEDGKIRGSARGIEEFNVFEALNYCQDLLGKFGGHKAAGGFSLARDNLAAFTEKLSEFAHQLLEPEHLKPLVKIDGAVNFTDLTPEFYQQIDQLHPWGIGNPEPIFWTKNVQILEQRTIGKNHLKFSLGQTIAGQTFTIKAIAWQWGDYLPLPPTLDIAYKLKENRWNGEVNLELELVGARPSEAPRPAVPDREMSPQAQPQHSEKTFLFNDRTYFCTLADQGLTLRIRNDQGKLLAIKKGQRQGKLGEQTVDVTQPPFFQMIKTAIATLEQAN